MGPTVSPSFFPEKNVSFYGVSFLLPEFCNTEKKRKRGRGHSAILSPSYQNPLRSLEEEFGVRKREKRRRNCLWGPLLKKEERRRRTHTPKKTRSRVPFSKDPSRKRRRTQKEGKLDFFLPLSAWLALLSGLGTKNALLSFFPLPPPQTIFLPFPFILRDDELSVTRIPLFWLPSRHFSSSSPFSYLKCSCS